MKLIGIVTSYYPDIQLLEHNIRTYLNEVDKLVIWENTPEEKSNIQQLAEQLNSPKVEIRTSGKNEFLAKPFNTCIPEAIAQGYTHILTMDQDSYFENQCFANFVAQVKRHNNPNTLIFTSAKSENKQMDAEEIEVENAITSGTIYVSSLFEKIGFFREDFLIYMIDIEMAMRARSKGYRIICFPRIILNHFTGYARKNRWGLRIDNYSPQSTYYIIRNVILNWQIYPQQFSRKEKLSFYRYKVGYRTAKIMFETQPLRKLKAIYLGLFHGLTGRSGQFDI